MKKIVITIGISILSLSGYSQFVVEAPATDAALSALNGIAGEQATTLGFIKGGQVTTNEQLGAANAKLMTSNEKLALVVQRQNEIRANLRNPALVAKFDIAIKLLSMIQNIACTKHQLPYLIKKTNAQSFCGFNLRYNSVSIELSSAAQFLSLALTLTSELSSAERTEKLKTAFEYFQIATNNYLNLTNLLQYQVNNNQKINNRRSDMSTMISKTF